MSTASSSEKRERLKEWMLTSGVSAVVSAITVAWTMSATLQDFRNKQQQQEKAIAVVEARVLQMEGKQAEQSTQIAYSKGQYEAILQAIKDLREEVRELRR
jgi:uncharacterized membrane protein